MSLLKAPEGRVPARRGRVAREESAQAGDELPDDRLLEQLQRDAFGYFLKEPESEVGLIADTTRPGAPSSIASVGFALASYPVGVERGWIERSEAVSRILVILRFFMASDQSGAPDATGYRGFYYHFLDIHTGRRTWQSEVSLIDTAFLIAGTLTTATYFSAESGDEKELRALADALYRRVDWRWAERDGAAVVHGWKPECGFLHYGWEGYSEAILLYMLGLGSPTHPLTPESFKAWTLTYQWENIYGIDVLYAGPLFIHQFSHAWIDFRGIRDAFMREKNCDYFENSRRATLIQREYAIRNPRSFRNYGADCWGFSAGEGPSTAPRLIAGRRQPFYGYAARGVPYGPDDGTVAGSSMLCSLVFAPKLVGSALRAWLSREEGGEDWVQASGFNSSAVEPDASPWVSPGRFGLDQGMIVLMIENYRSGLPWRLGRSNNYLRTGLKRAGFRGGWL